MSATAQTLRPPSRTLMFLEGRAIHELGAFLGALPLTMTIREQTDSGRPTVVANPDSPEATIYEQIARKVAVKVAEKAKDMTSKFPSIVIKND